MKKKFIPTQARGRLLTATLSFLLIAAPWSGTLSAQGVNSQSDNRMNRVSDLTLSISVESKVLSESRGATVTATITNASSLHFPVSAVGFTISTKSKHISAEKTGETFRSTFQMKQCRDLKPFETCRFQVRLNDLYWKDMFSDDMDLAQPKNLFKVISPDRYYLFMDFSKSSANSNTGAPLLDTTTSNEVIITVK